MEIKMEIICKNFEQKKIVDNKVYDVEQSEEYYVVPLNKSYDMEYDDELFKLTFENQQLWLKYSNYFNEMNLKECEYSECVIIKSEDILDIYVKIISSNYFRKNVWASHTSVYMNKKYLSKHYLVLPIVEDMIKIKEFGEGIPIVNIEMVTNEVLLREVTPYGNHGLLNITTNFLLNKDALFIRLDDEDVLKFIE